MVIARRKRMIAESRWERLQAVYDYANARWTLAKNDKAGESWRAMTHRLEEMFAYRIRTVDFSRRQDIEPSVPPERTPMTSWDFDEDELELVE